MAEYVPLPRDIRTSVILDATQILALAPDAASAKAGSGLAIPRNWSSLGRNDVALWGECQGSGKQPYRTQIDLGEPAFKCSCPSRKFPCKHGLGLYLLLDASPTLFDSSDAPPWVRDWLQSRQGRQEKKAEKAAAGSDPSPEAAAVAAAQARKREEKREEKVGAGLRELQTWLHDLAREGLAAVRSRGQGFWDAIAARMVDAQAAPLARRLRRAGGMLYQSSLPNAEQLLAHELASLYLLAGAWQRRHGLPPALQADVRALLGWTLGQDDVLREPAWTERWRILSQTVAEDDRLRVRASWLRGAASGRWALILQYAAGTQGFEQALVAGTEFDGALHFYPGAFPLRALVGQQADVRSLRDGPGRASTIETLLDDYAHALAVQPFLDRFPVLLADLVPDAAGQGILRDAHGRCIGLHPAFRHGTHLLALSGGQPLTVFGEWDGRTLLPLSVWHEGRLYNVDTDFIL
jgi:hypothetical protein